MAAPSPPTESRILTLAGHVAGEGKESFIKLEIDWLEDVLDLKESIKAEHENTLRRFDAHQLILYKLGNEGVDYEGLKHSPPYDLAAYQNKLPCLLLKDSYLIHECWPLDEKGAPSNKKYRLHFLLVVPDTQGNPRYIVLPSAAHIAFLLDLPTLIPSQDEEEVLINKLARGLGEWCQSTQANPPEEVEMLEDLGHKFPLQQCDSLVRRLRAHMLDSFKFKFVGRAQWLERFSIPIVAAAPGTGKTAICTRFLDEMAVWALEHNSPPTTVALKETPDDHGLTNTAQNNINAIQMIVADSEGHLPKPAELESLPLHWVWTEPRLVNFRQKVINSARRRLTLTVDLMNSELRFSASHTLESDLAAALLHAYSKRFPRDGIWQEPEDLTGKLAGYRSPLSIALRVFRILEGDNIIVIHLDETQAVPSEVLKTLVKLLVKQMHYKLREKVPWIFPILSGLSLESLLDLRQTSGAQVVRYTPPVLSISSMLNIIQTMFYTNDEQGAIDVANRQVKQPHFQKGFIRLLHDLRGPTRYFQAVLLYIQDSSGIINTQSVKTQWTLDATINREAIRAGIKKPDQNWGDIFDQLANLSSETIFKKDVHKLQKDPKLLQRLFDLHLSGESIWVKETFTIMGEAEPLSTIFEHGWATIVDTTKDK